MQKYGILLEAQCIIVDFLLSFELVTLVIPLEGIRDSIFCPADRLSVKRGNAFYDL